MWLPKHTGCRAAPAGLPYLYSRPMSPGGALEKGPSGLRRGRPPVKGSVNMQGLQTTSLCLNSSLPLWRESTRDNMESSGCVCVTTKFCAWTQNLEFPVISNVILLLIFFSRLKMQLANGLHKSRSCVQLGSWAIVCHLCPGLDSSCVSVCAYVCTYSLCKCPGKCPGYTDRCSESWSGFGVILAYP